jgi:hypothetical protein
MDTQTPQSQPIKFSKEFTAEIEKYIAIYKKQGKKPTIAGFANRIGTDEKSIWAWATKKKKDDEGNVIDEFARPNFHAAVKKLQALEEEPEQEKLNPQQELFCQYYATDREFFGNGVESYLEVYEIDRSKPNWYKTACAAASRLLSDVKVCKRINELLSDEGLNDSFVDKQLLFVIAQHEDKAAKVAAIREYNKVHKGIAQKLDIDLKSGGQPLQQVVGFTVVAPNNDAPTNKPDTETVS